MWCYLPKKGINHLSVNVFSTKVLIYWGHCFYISNWRWDLHFTWSSAEPHEGLAACSAKGVSSFLSYFETLSIDPAPGIKPTTSCSAVKCSTDRANQHAKKVVSDSPGLVDFAIGLVNSVRNLPDGQVEYFEEFNLQKNCEILLIKKFWGLVEMTFGQVNASFSLPEWQAVKMTFFAPC